MTTLGSLFAMCKLQPTSTLQVLNTAFGADVARGGRCFRTVVTAVALVSSFITLTTHGQRPPPRVSDDRELKEIDLTAWDCLNKSSGTARTPDGVERNALKNRPPTDVSNLKLQDWDIPAFVKNLSSFDTATFHKRRKDLEEAERQQLDPMEKDIVQVTCYLGIAYCGPPETTNCASIDFHDWHLELFEKPIQNPPAIGDTTPIICEITPRTQNAIFNDKIRIRELTAFLRLADLTFESTGHPARKVRIIGYRLWDDEHNGAADVGTTVKRANPNGYHNPWRQTAWEIHPVIKIIPLETPMKPVPTSDVPLTAPAAAPKTTPTATPSEAATETPAAIETPAATPTATAAGTPAPVEQTPPAPPQFVTITRPVTIQIPYGQITLQRGTKLPLLSRDAQNVTVQYMGEKYQIPAASTDMP